MISEEKPVQQKLRKIHPNLESQIKIELNKLLKAKKIFLEYEDVLAWDYEYLKSFMNINFKHKIPLKLDATPF